MKKEDVTSMFVYLIIVAATIVFAFTILQDGVKGFYMTQTMYILYIIGAFVVGIILNGILFELGHIIGAKAGRYQIVSVNILAFTFYRNKENKLKFKFSSPNGLIGDTKIVPLKDAKKEPNPRLYLMMGTIIYFIELIVGISLFICFKSDEVMMYFAYFVLVVIFSGGMIFFYNIIPMKLDSNTDGYYLTLINNPKNKVAFNELLRVEYAMENGEKDVEIKLFDEITNFTAQLNLNKAYLALEKEDYDTALNIINDIIAADKSVSEKVHLRALSQKVYIYLISLPLDEAKAKIEEEIDPKYRREISMDNSMVSARAYILLAGLVDGSKHEIYRTIENIQKAFKHTNKNLRDMEVPLFNKALNKVNEVHPTWELDKYMLKEKDKASEDEKTTEKAEEVIEEKTEEVFEEKSEEKSDKE